jgi:hypothetical protein
MLWVEGYLPLLTLMAMAFSRRVSWRLFCLTVSALPTIAMGSRLNHVWIEVTLPLIALNAMAVFQFVHWRLSVLLFAVSPFVGVFAYLASRRGFAPPITTSGFWHAVWNFYVFAFVWVGAWASLIGEGAHALLPRLGIAKRAGYSAIYLIAMFSGVVVGSLFVLVLFAFDSLLGSGAMGSLSPIIMSGLCSGATSGVIVAFFALRILQSGNEGGRVPYSVG